MAAAERAEGEVRGAAGGEGRRGPGAGPRSSRAEPLPWLSPQVEEAGHVFLLMRKDYRISRNVRLAWVLSRLHQVIWALPEPELVSGDGAGRDGPGAVPPGCCPRAQGGPGPVSAPCPRRRCSRRTSWRC